MASSLYFPSRPSAAAAAVTTRASDHLTGDFYLNTIRAAGVGRLRGWEREKKRLWPTLTRQSLAEDWGFSLISGRDDMGDASAHWSGIVAHRNDKGLWLKVGSIKSDSPADLAGLKSRDFITRINGQIVFHLTLKDAERLIRDSGCTLYLDIERDGPKSMMYYDRGLANQKTLNFLYKDYNPDLGM